jgi:hypothetical protein
MRMCVSRTFLVFALGELCTKLPTHNLFFWGLGLLKVQKPQSLHQLVVS